MTTSTEITYRPRHKMIGVWVDGEPAGRIRESDGRFRAFTNRRAPGSALLGTFDTRDEAGDAVAAEHKRGR